MYTSTQDRELNSAAADVLQGVTGENKLVPLNRMKLKAKYNVRTIRGDKGENDGIEELAKLILAAGLLHRLIVVAFLDDESGEIMYAPVDGGRRYRALMLLVTQGHIPLDQLVESKEVTEEVATMISLTGNSGREDLHPLDEFQAFLTMHEAGKSIEEISAFFSKSPLTVMRRMKMAKVAPVFLEEYRNGEITLDVLMALATTDDHDLQIAVWESLSSWQRNANFVRQRIVNNEMDSMHHPIAKFIGLDDYLAAGGTTRSDLFSDNGEGIFFDNPLLAYSLAQEKLSAIAEAKIKPEGWSWVEVRESFENSDSVGFLRAKKVARTATTEEQTELDRLNAELDEVNDKIETLESASGDEGDGEEATQGDEDGEGEADDDACEKLYAKVDELEEQINAIESNLFDYDFDTKARSGAIVTLNARGEVNVVRGLILPDDQQAADAVLSETGTGVFEKKKKPRPEFSEKLVQKLTAARTLGLQAKMATNASIALVSVVHSLARRRFTHNYYNQPAAKVSADDHFYGLETLDPTIVDAPAYQSLSAQREGWKAELGELDDDQLFSYLMAMSPERVMELFCLCVAFSVDVVARQVDDRRFDPLCAALGLDMTAIWQADTKRYLPDVSRDKIIEAVREAKGEEATVGLEKLKKGDLVEKASRLLAGTGWLPKVLRS